MKRAIKPLRTSKLAAALVGVVVAVIGCSNTHAVISDPGRATSLRLPVIPAGVCVDGTASSAASAAPNALHVLSAAIRRWSPPPPRVLPTSATGQPGLEFVLRSVQTHSFTTDGERSPVTIPAVAALPARPSPGSDSFTSQLRQWQNLQAVWATQARAAGASAGQLATYVHGYQPMRHTSSGIWTCVAALTATLGTDAGTTLRLIAATDALNNQPVVGLDLNGARVLLLEFCPAYASNGCPARFARARKYLLAHGASSVSLARADAVSPTDIVNFWKDGS